MATTRLSPDAPSFSVQPARAPAAAGSGHAHPISSNAKLFLSFNANSLQNKIDELSALIASLPTPPILIAVCESWCVPTEPDSLYALQDYLLFRRDRMDRVGGGVVIYAHSPSISSALRLSQMETANEDVWLSLQLKNTSKSLTVCTTYRPPSADGRQFVQNLEQSLRATHGSPLLLLGDLNAKCQEWYPEDPTDNCGEMLQQLFHAYTLEQIVDFPTNIYSNRLKSCLDLAATNVVGVHISSLPPLGRSDHVVLLGHLPVEDLHSQRITDRNQVTAPRTAWCWGRADLEGLKQAITDDDWTDVTSSPVVETAWTRWKAKIALHVHRFVPRKRLCTRPMPRPWITREIQQHVKTKHRLFRLHKRHPTSSSWQTYTTQRNLVCRLLRRAKSDYVTRLAQTQDEDLDDKTVAGEHTSRSTPPPDRNTATDIPRLHQLLRCLLRSKDSTVPNLQLPDGTFATADVDKAETLNNFFTEQSQLSAHPGEIPTITTARAEDRLADITVDQDTTRKLLLKLNPRKASGDDGVSIKLLHHLATEIAPCLTYLFWLSLDTGQLPSDWRQATVSPIFKKGSRALPSNYRPISLLSCTSKVLESIVSAQLYNHISKHLPSNQSGFRRKDGTAPQLARIVHTISQALDNGQIVLSCFYDLSKAFDRVWHAGLIAKLEHLGVSGRLLRWLEAYLTARKQRVRIGSSVSSWALVPAGVPQGSVLGPLLFITYTYDIPAEVEAPVVCNQFADDTALTSIQPTRHQAQASLQTSVNRTGSWLTRWRLAANLGKTNIMEITRSTLPAPANITLYGKPLTVSQQQRHLGLIFTSDLKWTAHIDRVLAKAGRLLAVLRRLSHLSSDAKSSFYLLYIRPQLEYADIAWSNLPQRQLDRLERFQRRAAKLVLGIPLFRPSPHGKLLADVGWPTIKSRRKLRLVLLARALHTKTAPPHLLAVALTSHSLSYNLRQPNTFTVPTARTQHFHDSPLLLSADLYNSLPLSIRNLKSHSAFKRSAAQYVLTSRCTCSRLSYMH